MHQGFCSGLCCIHPTAAGTEESSAEPENIAAFTERLTHQSKSKNLDGLMED
jgi:hypothetical protein